MANYKTPGVYVEEVSTFPPSVAAVATAVPAFIGYTEIVPGEGGEPVVERITSMLEFMTAFGAAFPAKFSVTKPSDSAAALVVSGPNNIHKFSLYYALSHYFKNGGGPCYVVSVGTYQATPAAADFSKGIEALEQEDEPTLIILTDAACLLSSVEYYGLCGEALAQCKKLGDRFTILDVVPTSSTSKKDWEAFRDDSNLSINLDYGAAYTPYLQSSLNYLYSEDDVDITVIGADGAGPSEKVWSDSSDNGLLVTYSGDDDNSKPEVKITASGDDIVFSESEGNLEISGVNSKTATQVAAAWDKSTDKVGGYSIEVAGNGEALVQHTNKQSVKLTESTSTDSTPNTMTSLVKDTDGKPVAKPKTGLYNQIKAALSEQRIVLPPSAAVAGVYARTDREQGVWKSPANAGVMAVLGPIAKITDDQQDRLNVDPTAGKSINAIRAFTGKGTLVWGARTLAGNDNEWRYVSVRRLFITIEESTKKASAFAVFEANNQATWLKVKAMIDSYLYGLWQQGALAGADADAAYYVNVGLGTTMTPDDVLNGRMIVEIGVAAVRPAEFIILRFSHKLQTA
ncbi:MAG: phage tail sheath protein FI/FlaG/FlaF family flagellin (archaellin) [Halioglobus sp.]|jgi:phage tail sheath protein FI/FlaG/FlaF family flagellin (archaellin)